MLKQLLVSLVVLIVAAVGTMWIETLMPPVVTGAIVCVIGLNLAPIAVKGVSGAQFDSWMALVTVLCVGGAEVFTRGMLQRLLILVGLLVAYVIYAIVTNGMGLGKPVDFTEAERLTMHLRPSLMRRAIRNLIENAVKYGGGAEVSLRCDAKTVEIAVCDNGPGIPPSQREEVFQPFRRLNGSRNSPGAGLGLALVKAVAARHRAKVELSDNHPGLRVTLSFPPAA